MKTIRFAVLFVALVLLMTTVVPFAAQPVAAQTEATVQTFAEAALEFPLLTPLNMVSIPVITVSVESMSASKDYGCTLLSQKPKDWTRMQRRQIFDATWTVKNTGRRNWGKNGIDFKYVSGTKMHTWGSSYDLSKDVGPGKSITLITDMVAPKTKGYYTATWGLYRGSQIFCRLSVTINVNR